MIECTPPRTAWGVASLALQAMFLSVTFAAMAAHTGLAAWLVGVGIGALALLWCFVLVVAIGVRGTRGIYDDGANSIEVDQ